jgi:hypothetical protein
MIPLASTQALLIEKERMDTSKDGPNKYSFTALPGKSVHPLCNRLQGSLPGIPV